MEVTVIPIVIDGLGTVNQRIDAKTGDLGNKRTCGDHPNYWITEIGQNTEKSPGDLRRLAVTQTPVRIRLLTLVWKTQKWVVTIIIIIVIIKTGHDWVGKMINGEMCKKFKNWPYEQMVYAQPIICPGEWPAQSMGLWHTNGSLNLGQKTRPYSNQQKKRIWKIVDFAVSADNRIKMKESEKKDEYLDFARELKKIYGKWMLRLYQLWLEHLVQ